MPFARSRKIGHSNALPPNPNPTQSFTESFVEYLLEQSNPHHPARRASQTAIAPASPGQAADGMRQVSMDNITPHARNAVPAPLDSVLGEQ